MIINSHEVQKEVDSNFLSAYPHYVLPSVNLNESVDLSDCALEDPQKCLAYSCSLPVPAIPTYVGAAPLEDPALTLVKEKLDWKHDVKLHTDYLIKAKKVKDLEKLLSDATKKGITTFGPREAEFVKLFSNNPDEHFDGVYNWYYTGGCINKLELNGTTIVIFSQGKKMDQVCALPLKSDKKWQLDSNIFTVTTPTPNSLVFELCCENVHGKGIIGVRYRNGCCIFSMTSLRRVELLHRSVSSYPFTSLDISKHLEGRYCTVSTERDINVWDAESDSQIFSMTVPMPQKNMPDKWNCIRWSNSRCLVMVDRYYIQMVDVRKKDVIDLFSPRKDSHLLHECEMLSLIFPSAVSSTAMYVTTSHQVLLYDTRKSCKPLQQWSHLLRTAPLYGSAVLIEDGKEAACFANQQLCEMSLILNCFGEEHPIVALPNMKDALRAAHRNGLWLDPACQQQLKLSWTGMTWLPPHKSKLTLLTINSAGDVFNQALTLKKENKGSLNEEHHVSFSEDIVINNYSARDLKCLKKWEKHFIKRKMHFMLKATRRTKMKHVFKSLRTCSFALDKAEDCDIDKEDASRWKMSKAEMLHYKDVMAPVLLQTWEIDDEDEWHVDTDERPVTVHENAPTATQKVQAWLNVSLQSSSALAKNTNTFASAVKRRSNTVVPNTAQSPDISDLFSEMQNESISQHRDVDPLLYSAITYRSPDVRSRIFASSTPSAKDNMLSQNTFSSQLYSSQSQTECLLSSQNTILTTSKPRTVKKNKHISGF